MKSLFILALFFTFCTASSFFGRKLLQTTTDCSDKEANKLRGGHLEMQVNFNKSCTSSKATLCSEKCRDAICDWVYFLNDESERSIDCDVVTRDDLFRFEEILLNAERSWRSDCRMITGCMAPPPAVVSSDTESSDSGAGLYVSTFAIFITAVLAIVY